MKEEKKSVAIPATEETIETKAEAYAKKKEIDRWVCTPDNIRKNAKEDFIAGASSQKEETARDILNELVESLQGVTPTDAASRVYYKAVGFLNKTDNNL